MSALDDIDRRAMETMLNYYQFPSQPNKKISDETPSLFDKIYTLPINSSTWKDGNLADIYVNKALSMRRDRRAFVDIRVWWDNNQSDILMPITVSTSLDYGKDKDFYFKNHPSRLPSNINIRKGSSLSTLEIRLGENAKNINDENITIQLEQPLGQILRRGSSDVTFQLDNGTFSQNMLI